MAGLCLAGLGGSKAINSILVPCFSFSPSQQGTWSLLGTNYWPSVGAKCGPQVAGAAEKTTFGGKELFS